MYNPNLQCQATTKHSNIFREIGVSEQNKEKNNAKWIIKSHLGFKLQ